MTLQEILRNLALNDYMTEARAVPDIEQAVIRIQALVAEVIGGDESIGNTPDVVIRRVKLHRRQLRKEQRQRAKERGLL